MTPLRPLMVVPIVLLAPTVPAGMPLEITCPRTAKRAEYRRSP
jgi:hypothetical protein